MDPFHTNEQQLIESAISGDKEAFGCLYDHYFLQLYKYFFYRSGDKEDAEDLTANVFIKAWEHLPGFGKNNKHLFFRAWLFKIAHNSLIDSYRTKKKSISLNEEVKLENPTGEPLVVITRNDRNKRISEAVKCLDEKSQRVIVSRFVSGLSHKETALSMGISEGNVRIIQYRALKKLKEFIREEYE